MGGKKTLFLNSFREEKRKAAKISLFVLLFPKTWNWPNGICKTYPNQLVTVKLSVLASATILTLAIQISCSKINGV